MKSSSNCSPNILHYEKKKKVKTAQMSVFLFFKIVICLLTGLFEGSNSLGWRRWRVSSTVPFWGALVITRCRWSSCHFKVTVLLRYAVQLLMMKCNVMCHERLKTCVGFTLFSEDMFYCLSQYSNSFVSVWRMPLDCKFSPCPQHLNHI